MWGGRGWKQRRQAPCARQRPCSQLTGLVMPPTLTFLHGVVIFQYLRARARGGGDSDADVDEGGSGVHRLAQWRRGRRRGWR